MIFYSEIKNNEGEVLKVVPMCLIEPPPGFQQYLVLGLDFDKPEENMSTPVDNPGYQTNMMGKLYGLPMEMQEFLKDQMAFDEWNFAEFPNPQVLCTEVIIKGLNRLDRCHIQLREWVKGISIHNGTDNECCPDFSCCQKGVNTPIERRKEFLKVFEAKGAAGAEKMLV